MTFLRVNRFAQLKPVFAQDLTMWEISRIRVLSVISSIVFAGCAKEPPQIVMVSAEPVQIHLPAECTSRDPAWQALPDADVRRDAAARNYASNRRQYSEILGKRSVCRAAINVQTKKG